jgi:mono/diheme cytochrome c family protein
MRIALLILCAFGSLSAQAVDVNPQRAKFHYQMHCEGCHTPDGTGAMSVPRMKDQVGLFLETEAGRDYLVKVPGSATSALDDEELAEVLNWILVEMGGASVAANFEPYTAREVGDLRDQPLNEVERYRIQLLLEIADQRSGQANRP